MIALNALIGQNFYFDIVTCTMKFMFWQGRQCWTKNYHNVACVLALYKSYWAINNKIFIHAHPCVKGWCQYFLTYLITSFNSYVSFMLSKLPACIHNSIYSTHAKHEQILNLSSFLYHFKQNLFLTALTPTISCSLVQGHKMGSLSKDNDNSCKNAIFMFLQ